MIRARASRGSASFLVAVSLLLGVVWPQTAVAAPTGSITWTVDHAAKTITVNVKLEIYSGCGGNPEGEPAERARACTGAASQVTLFLAQKIKAQIEKIWNKPYAYRCYRLIVNVDVKLGSDGLHIDPDRIGVQIDPSPAGIRDFVSSSSGDDAHYLSDNPADKVDPTNSAKNPTTWGEESQSNEGTYAHEFGHILGLTDTYHDVTDPQTGRLKSVPYPDAPDDLMSDSKARNIDPLTIDRVVRRNFPVMHDTEGKTVSDADLKCDVMLTIDSALVHQEIGVGALSTAHDLYVTPEPDEPIRLTVDDKGGLTGTSQVHLDGEVKVPLCVGAYHSIEQIDITGTLTTTSDNKRIVNIKITGPPETGVSTIKCPRLGRSMPFGGHGGFANRWATVIGPLTLTVGDPPLPISLDGNVGGIKTHSDGDFSAADASPPPS